MFEDVVREMLRKVQEGSADVEKALSSIKESFYEELGFAKVDHHRSFRTGLPEIIFGEGKNPEQVGQIAWSMWEKGENVLVTRADARQYAAVKNNIPCAQYSQTARTITAKQKETREPASVAVLSAGTADLPVAEEAALTLEFLGVGIHRLYDVGVAGIHRLLGKLDVISSCQVVIVAAGMDGALPSVVAGLIPQPVIAVPTSIGYGANFSGLSALLAMLNTCAAGVGVVNIDNGFGAAALAHAIIRSGRSAE